VLPDLSTRLTIVETSRPLNGKLFVEPARTIQEQREERRATIRQRCETVAQLADTGQSFVAWCHLNDEADLLEDLIPGARQVSGQHDDDEKEELFEAFRVGQLRALVTKPKIGAFGLNWQHCAHMSVFPSHSYEQYYQAVRRCWRFGQTRPVIVDVVSTAGEADVMGSLQRKSDAAERMFQIMVEEMHNAQRVAPRVVATAGVKIPEWMVTR
jgi:superfamily II DNA or RNA helicase